MAEDRSSRRDERRRHRNPAPPPVGLRRGPDGKVILDTLDAGRSPNPAAEGREAVPTPEEPEHQRPEGGEGSARPEEGERRAPPAEAAGQVRRGPLRFPRRNARGGGERTSSRGASRPAAVTVGGPLRPSTTVHFGRPPGTENRPAGAAASVAVGLLAMAMLLPWATRSPDTLAVTTVGWRDAGGGAGPAWWALILAVPATAAAVAGLAGRIHSWWRILDAATGAAALLVAGVELWRIRAASETVAELSAGDAGLAAGPALALVAAAGAAMVVAAALHRDEPPAWHRTDAPAAGEARAAEGAPSAPAGRDDATARSGGEG